MFLTFFTLHVLFFLFLVREKNCEKSHCTFLYTQGDPANGMYFVESGTVSVLKKSDDGEEKIVSIESLKNYRNN